MTTILQTIKEEVKGCNISILDSIYRRITFVYKFNINCFAHKIEEIKLKMLTYSEENGNNIKIIIIIIF